MTPTITAPETREIPIGLLLEPTTMSRLSIEESDIRELGDDIRRRGLLYAIIVVPEGERYRIIAGHRRYHACLYARLAAVRCDVYQSSEGALEGVKYAENRFRKQLTAAEEAEYFNDMLERHCEGDVDKLCEFLGEKRGYVENRLSLKLGDAGVFDAVRAEKIPLGVAHQLNKCTDPTYRHYLLHQAIVGGATSAVVTGWITDWRRQQDLTDASPSAPVAPLAPAPMAETNYFRCAVCLGEDNVHTMIPINVHSHCKLAILDRLLETYHGA